jgi:hypothetical protein
MPATRIRLLRPYCSSESRLAINSKTKMTGSQLPVKSPSNIQLVDVNVNREIEQSSVIPHLSLSEEDMWDCLFVAFCCVESTLLEYEFSRDELIWYTGRFIDSRLNVNKGRYTCIPRDTVFNNSTMMI